MMVKKSSGFSLVELMVAMVIGLIIILGAGQLFLTVIQGFRQVEALGEKQAALNFAAEVLLRDVRRSYWAASEWDGEVLQMIVPNRGDAVGCEDVYKEYFIAQRDGENLLSLRQGCSSGALGNSQEIVGGFAEDGFQVMPIPGGAVSLAEGYGVLIRFVLSPASLPNDDVVEFYAINRTAAVQGAVISGDPGSPGGGGSDDDDGENEGSDSGDGESDSDESGGGESDGGDSDEGDNGNTDEQEENYPQSCTCQQQGNGNTRIYSSITLGCPDSCCQNAYDQGGGTCNGSGCLFTVSSLPYCP